MKRLPWAMLTAIVIGVLIWHGVFRMPRPDPSSQIELEDFMEPTRPPGHPQPSAAGAPDPGAALQAREDELAFMQRVRASQDPAEALELAREGDRRFPTGSSIAERAAIITRSLAKLGRLSEARGEAERLVHDYPDTPWAHQVEQHRR